MFKKLMIATGLTFAGIFTLAMLAVVATTDTDTTDTVDATPETTQTTTKATEPPAKKAPAKKAAPKPTMGQAQALRAAEGYLDVTAFSRDGLIRQLTSEFEGHARKDAVWAVDHLDVSWKKQAVEAGRSYLEMGTGMSRQGLIQQLSSKVADRFTVAQATYAADKLGL